MVCGRVSLLCRGLKSRLTSYSNITSKIYSVQRYKILGLWCGMADSKEIDKGCRVGWAYGELALQPQASFQGHGDCVIQLEPRG